MNQSRPGMLFLVAGLFLASILTGCSSTTVLSHGENQMVRFQQFDKKTHECTLELLLVEESHKDYQDFYSQQRPDGNIKLIPAEMYKRLVLTLDDFGYVEMARPRQLGSDPRTPGTSKIICVENDSGRWVCTNSKEDLTDDQRQDFTNMEKMILACYDSVLSLQVITNEKGGQLFFDEQQKLQHQEKMAKPLFEGKEKPKEIDP